MKGLPHPRTVESHPDPGKAAAALPDRHELGDFLRTRRTRLSPESVGLPVTRRRRTAGLRREEVAELAGIGVDWYVRLEQGRPVTPSAATLAALASALRLHRAGDGASSFEHVSFRSEDDPGLTLVIWTPL